MPIINPVQLLSFAEKHPKNYHISHIPFNPNTYIERRTSLGEKTIVIDPNGQIKISQLKHSGEFFFKKIKACGHNLIEVYTGDPNNRVVERYTYGSFSELRQIVKKAWDNFNNKSNQYYA